MDRPDFHQLAERELNEAAQYYDVEEPGLGLSFLQELDHCLQSIDQAQRHPDSRSDESQAAPCVLGQSRVKSRQPNFCFPPTGYARD